MLPHALTYAKRGWSVFPLLPRSKKPYPGSTGLGDATTDPRPITSWWSDHPNSNIGIACGASGLVVVDLDTHKDGIASWKALGIPTNTLVSKTGGGGAHIFYSSPGTPVPNSVSKLGPGIDIRGNGGYVVAPPSVHPSGTTYSWHTDLDTPLAPFPKQLLDTLLDEPGGGPGPGNDKGDLIPKGTRNDTLMRLAGGMRRHGMTPEEMLAALLVVANTRCVPPLSQKEVATIVESAGKYEPNEVVDLRLTDLGNAEWLVKTHGTDLRYVQSWKSWLVWNDHRWVKDDTGEVIRRAKDAVRRIYKVLPNIDDDDLRTKVAKHALRSESGPKLKTMVSLAQSERQVAVLAEGFDTNNYLLNVRNGTLDLRTGKLHPHHKEDLITKYVDVDWDEDARWPQWSDFLNLTLNGDKDLIEFVQKAVGYALTGATKEQVIFFLYGTGANGKSTFLEAIRHIAGTYGQVMPPRTLMSSANRGGVPSDVARLKGARLVTTVETEEGRRLAEGLVKQMTGGDTMVARFMYGEWFEFMPTHKIFLATNHKPIIHGDDWAIWRRLRLIPFEVTIERKDQVLNYFETVLRPELPGILRWAVDGCLAWQKAGLHQPRVVAEATGGYRKDMDRLGTFLEDECEVGQGDDFQVGATALYTTYKEWCDEVGIRPLSMKRVMPLFVQRGFDKVRIARGNVYLGLKLRVGV